MRDTIVNRRVLAVLPDLGIYMYVLYLTQRSLKIGLTFWRDPWALKNKSLVQQRLRSRVVSDLTNVSRAQVNIFSKHAPGQKPGQSGQSGHSDSQAP